LAEGDAERAMRAAAAMDLIRKGEADDMKVLKALLPSAGRDQLHVVRRMRAEYERSKQDALRRKSESDQFRLPIDGAGTTAFGRPKKG
jgi:hypothetical protein